MPDVGLIGLGLLGSAMAHRLRAAGFSLVGFDLESARQQEFVVAGGIAAGSPHEVFARCDRVLLSLPNSSIVRRLLAEVGDSIRPGQLIIDTTTGSPEETEAIGAQLAARSIGYVDATVAGSSRQTRDGDVIVMAGGEPSQIERADELLRTFARTVHRVGGCGSGARMKLVVNLVLGLSRAVLAEGLEFAASLGLDRPLALAILKDSPAASRVMETKGEKMLNGEFVPEARLAQHLKDVRLILESGRRAGAALPLSRIHAELLESLVDRGLGDLDNSVVVRAFQRPASTDGAGH